MIKLTTKTPTKMTRFQQDSSLGGKKTLAKFGSSHFSLLAKKMWIKRNAKSLQNPSEDNR